MKPANFPGRVNARRKVALTNMPPIDTRAGKYESNAELRALLATRIMTDEHARSIRTKIRRESP